MQENALPEDAYGSSSINKKISKISKVEKHG